METIQKNCQSCGMPMKRDAKGGGTKSDGTKSLMYCSNCYELGKFIHPNMTADEMKLLVKGKLKEFGIPGIVSGVFTRNIPKLARWKTHS